MPEVSLWWLDVQSWANIYVSKMSNYMIKFYVMLKKENVIIEQVEEHSDIDIQKFLFFTVV